MRRRDVAGPDDLDLVCDRRPVRVELAGLEPRQLAPGLLIESELVAGALLVDVEACAANQLVEQLRRGILVELRDPLRREHRAEAALPALRAQRDHRLGRLRLAAPALRYEEVRFVDHDDDRMPERSRERHELCQEQPDELAALLQVEIVEVDHRGGTELHEAPAEDPRRLRRGRDVCAATGEHVIEPLAERREFALRDPARAAARGRASARAAAGSRATSRRRCSPG
jgi:hypothetical protein